MHCDQYHAVEHMHSVVAYTIRIAEIAGLSDDPERVRGRVVAAIYHDSANGEEPGPAGVDEVDAIKGFIADCIDQRKGL